MFNYISNNLKVCAGVSAICFVAILIVAFPFISIVSEFVTFDEYVTIIAVASFPVGCIVSYILKIK